MPARIADEFLQGVAVLGPEAELGLAGGAFVVLVHGLRGELVGCGPEVHTLQDAPGAHPLGTVPIVADRAGTLS